jgi:hypothetical protein
MEEKQEEQALKLHTATHILVREIDVEREKESGTQGSHQRQTTTDMGVLAASRRGRDI